LPTGRSDRGKAKFRICKQKHKYKKCLDEELDGQQREKDPEGVAKDRRMGRSKVSETVAVVQRAVQLRCITRGEHVVDQRSEGSGPIGVDRQILDPMLGDGEARVPVDLNYNFHKSLSELEL
jgi:hypothetical protein